ncbi:hypothetical protein HNQ80_004062 [Anaerosolibacter carboniphilus]|uniref:Uncharacterized protein n=1 Tax=Anaerosolibacter carboniphilus TaxID=1417629 RepID=A0A841KW60_9FIRM|nr:hypothetical protein [Anaerosolibacter carboniphilus]MBB6217926.1 hypothetical protein [Anaerosolibacter carboniphilus]
MDFFGNILPFIIFVIFAISKSKKREAQGGRKREIPIGRNPEKKTVSPLSRMDELRKIGEQFGSTLRKEFQQLSEVDNREMTLLEDEEEAIDRYNENSTKEFVKKLDTPGIEMKNEIDDVIKASEIGGRRISFHKQSVRDGVIMAEVLGKPKSLRR